MYINEITTEHNHLVQGIQEDFKQNDGENPNHTSSPSDAQRSYCAKLDCWVDAVAGAKLFMVAEWSENYNDVVTSIEIWRAMLTIIERVDSPYSEKAYKDLQSVIYTISSYFVGGSLMD